MCWPRLWLVLPDAAKQELTEARARLDLAAQMWLWAALFVVWTPWAWWAPVLAVIVATFSYRSMVDAAGTFADLLDASFDLYRANLYIGLRWPLPQHPAEERASGVALTEYLWRGSDLAAPLFTNSGK